jgi:dTDP-4-amino-4,6-dideoxygalactose transaminase
VITTPLTFAATAEVIHYVRARPVFVDIDPDTFNIGPEQIRMCLERPRPRRRFRAILPVHIGGLPCEMDAILEMAKEHGLKVIEDAAHALPTEYKGRRVGTLGDVTAFSFYANKNITTGEGGMATTDNDEYADTMRIMRLHGISKDAWKRYTAKGSWYYEIHEPGFKYNMTDIAAAIGIHQLKKCDRLHKRRSRIARMYDQGLANVGEIFLPPRPSRSSDDNGKGYQHAWHLYVIRLNLKQLTITRDDLIELLKKRGIGTSVHFIPLNMQPYYRETYGYRPEDFPRARAVYEQIVSLPIYPKMTDADVEYVISALKETIFAHRRRLSVRAYPQKPAEVAL